jgi:hypothetical protein
MLRSCGDDRHHHGRSTDERDEIDMAELFADYNQHLSMLFGQIQEQLKMIAARLADISQRLPPRQ